MSFHGPWNRIKVRPVFVNGMILGEKFRHNWIVPYGGAEIGGRRVRTVMVGDGHAGAASFGDGRHGVLAGSGTQVMDLNSK